MAKNPSKFKKAPGAPRRFKSAYMFFSSGKHKEIRSKLPPGEKAITTPEVAKMVSSVWKTLPTKEREHWEGMAQRDKARFTVEMAAYKGPLKVPKGYKAKKDPKAPKRPTPAFLAYSNQKRDAVKRLNPGLGTNEISKILSEMWKLAPSEEKQIILDRDAALRVAYKRDMEAFKKSKATDQHKREANAVLQAVGDGLCSAVGLYSTIGDVDDEETETEEED